MRKEEFRIDSRDGVTKLYAVRWIPEGEIKGVIQIIHGMAEHMARYEHVAEWFTKRGFVVTGDDHLGHGKSVSEGGCFGYFCKQDPATVVVRDEHRLKKMTQEAYPGVPYFILGHSMGSFILRNYMYKYGTGIDGAIVCGTGGQPKSAAKFGLLLANVQSLFLGEKHIAQMISNIVFGKPKPAKEGEVQESWLCTDKEVCDKYDADPLCGFTFTTNGYKTLFTLIDRILNKDNLEKMPKNLPVLFISGSEDIVGEKSEGVKRVYSQYKDLNMQDIDMIIYEGLKHEILNETKKEEVFDNIYTWINKHLDR